MEISEKIDLFRRNFKHNKKLLITVQYFLRNVKKLVLILAVAKNSIFNEIIHN